MAIHHKTIPSLSALMIFEASARLGSFTGAAKELCVTPTAISKQIRQLEDFLNTKLFIRRKHGLNLTYKGELYLRSVIQALDTLTDASQIMDDNDHPSPLNVEIGACFSHFWLIPRLDNFRDKYPNITLNITINNERDIGDNVNYDVAFYYASLTSQQRGSYLLFNERILPVCSPSFLAKHPDCQDLKKIWQQPLLMLRDAPMFWENWQTWAERVGFGYQTPTNALYMEDQIAITQAALSGAGIALVWDWHVQDFLKNGELIALKEPIECHRNAFFLSCADNNSERNARRFIRWVIRQVSLLPPHSHLPPANLADSA